MTFLALYSLAEADSAEATLTAANIAYSRKIVEEEGMEYVELSVEDGDFEAAVAVLDAQEPVADADIDLGQTIHCPYCSGQQIAWFRHETNEAVVELLFCKCSGDHPVAMRDWETKRGRILPERGKER